MKVISFKVPHQPNEFFQVQIDRGQFFPYLHEHREVQISWVQQGSGTLIAGSYSGPFSVGDVFIIGSHQPHVFKTSEETIYEAEQPVMWSVYLHCDTCTTGLWQLQELEDSICFFAENPHSYALCREVSAPVTQQIQTLAASTGLDRVLNFLQLLKYLRDVRCSIRQLSFAGKHTAGACNEDRLEHVIRFTEQHYARTIKISELAALTNLTETSFCKYFKSRTGKTYVDYLNEVRIAKAAEHLLDDNRTISCVCYESGFSSLSNFNRSFKRINRVTPKEWRMERRRILL